MGNKELGAGIGTNSRAGPSVRHAYTLNRT